MQTNKVLEEFDEKFPYEVYCFDEHDGYGNNKVPKARAEIHAFLLEKTTEARSEVYASMPLRCDENDDVSQQFRTGWNRNVPQSCPRRFRMRWLILSGKFAISIGAVVGCWCLVSYLNAHVVAVCNPEFLKYGLRECHQMARLVWIP